MKICTKVFLLTLVLVATFPSLALAKGKKGKLNQALTVTRHDPVSHYSDGPEFVDVGLNSTFAVDHDAIVIVQGVFGADADGARDVVVAVMIDGVDDPDPLTWQNGHGPSSFLRSVTVPRGEHTVSVRFSAAGGAGQIGIRVGDRRMVVSVF